MQLKWLLDIIVGSVFHGYITIWTSENGKILHYEQKRSYYESSYAVSVMNDGVQAKLLACMVQLLSISEYQFQFLHPCVTLLSAI